MVAARIRDSRCASATVAMRRMFLETEIDNSVEDQILD